MKIYYLHIGEKQSGPFDIEELKQKDITKETPIWYQGLNDWTTAGEINELSSFFQGTPPPLKAAPPAYAHSSVNKEAVPVTKNRKPILYLGITTVIAVAVFLGIKNNETAAASHNPLDTSAEFANMTNKLAEMERKEKEKAERDAVLAKEQAELENQNREYRTNWEKYITFKNTEPVISYLLGGVSEFKVAVSNRTSFILDQVDISVDYIRKNGDVYKTETVKLFNVNPSSYETAIAPSSVNGVKIDVKISKIICKKMNFCYPSFSGEENDPYYCR